MQSINKKKNNKSVIQTPDFNKTDRPAKISPLRNIN